MNPLLRPTLATSAQPFDSAEHVFEIKWDGVRALAAVEGIHWRLWGRQGSDYGDRYPELTALRRLPSGTVVDGELVVLADGRADLNAVLRRHQLRRPDKVRHAGRRTPVHYLLFDLLFDRGRSLLEEPLERRRAVLAELTARMQDPLLVFSEGIVGPGRELFERAVAAGHEGVMAKHRTSRYRPGQRSPAWRKVKPTAMIPCLIVGYTPGQDGLRSLPVAAVQEGSLRYVAELTGGFAGNQKADLAGRLAARPRSEPVVACPKPALWVEPGLYCRVQFLRWTPAGRLRDAVFRGLLDDEA
jgi:DNA ligase D-like protein (predicted ligase)